MTRRIITIALLLLPSLAPAAEFDSSFDWVAVGALGPQYDAETENPEGDFVFTASLERSFKILTFRTQVGAFLYEDELPLLDRQNDAFVLFSAMDRFGEGPWALVVLGGGGWYQATESANFHVGLGFDYRFYGPWIARGEAVYHHEFEAVAVTIGGGYLF